MLSQSRKALLCLKKQLKYLFVVSKLKKEEFFKKFKIKNEGPYKIKRDLNEAIDRILRENHALV